MWIKLSYILLLISFVEAKGQGKQVKISGIVTDSVSTALSYVNVLAFPLGHEQAPSFAITNEIGYYELTLLTGKPYRIEVSYMGFSTQSLEITANKEKSQNFSLQPIVELLDEVELVYKIPVLIKKDTVQYNLEAFVSGQERKLKEALQKLPGIEVDRYGNVTALGKRINTVLVDGKPFINGNSKLAVNNIPANVVNQVEIIERYTQVSLLKGLATSNKTALNIKLKKNKQDFVFGDISLGAGERKNHIAKTNLFRYKPTSHINLIGNSNSINEPAFTFKDFLDFEGGMGNNIDGYSSLVQNNKALVPFFNNSPNTNAKQHFGAISYRKELTNNTDFNTYYVASDENLEKMHEDENTFVSQTQPFNENRNTTANYQNKFSLAKISLESKPNKGNEFLASIKYNSAKNILENVINSSTSEENNNFTKKKDLNNVFVNPNIMYTKKIGNSHTVHLVSDFFYVQNKQNSLFNASNFFLEEYITHNILGTKSVSQLHQERTTSIDANIKDYWVLGAKNHVYISIGFSKLEEHFNVAAHDIYTQNNPPVSISAFSNEVSFKNQDLYGGIEYKLKLGEWTLKPSFYLHNFKWNVLQKGKTIQSNKAVGIPALYVSSQINRTATLDLNYTKVAFFAHASQFSQTPFIQDFNSIINGNPLLQNETQHEATLFYRNFNLLKGNILISMFNYTKKIDGIKTDVLVQGINQNGTYTNMLYPDQTFSTRNSFTKKKKKYNFKIANQLRFSATEQLTAGARVINRGFLNKTEFSYTRNFNLDTSLKFGGVFMENQYKAGETLATFNSQNLYIELDWNILNHLFIKGNYSFEKYKASEQATRNNIHLGEFSLLYKKENSAWNFEFFGSNIFNNRYILNNSQSGILISNTRTFLQPRIWMFKINYNL